MTGEADLCQPHLPQQWSNLSYTCQIYVILRYTLLSLGNSLQKPDFVVYNLPAIFENGKMVESVKLTRLRRLLLKNEDMGSSVSAWCLLIAWRRQISSKLSAIFHVQKWRADHERQNQVYAVKCQAREEENKLTT